MADLYRKSAIEKMSSPERTDRTMEITTPLSWLVLIGLTLIVIVTVLWGTVFGTIPITVSGKGIVAPASGSNIVYMPENGTVTPVVLEGQRVAEGEVVMTYYTSDGRSGSIYSPMDCYVSEFLVKSGDAVKQSNGVIRYRPASIVGDDQFAVCYVSLADSKKIKMEDNVRIYLDSDNAGSTRFIMGKVVAIDTHAATTDGMNYVLGEGNTLSQTIQNSGAVVAVTCLFGYTRDHEIYWSGSRNADTTVQEQTPVTVKVVVDEVKPIEKMFANWKETWGGK